jgi:hypothetical protein
MLGKTEQEYQRGRDDHAAANSNQPTERPATNPKKT